MPRRLAIPAALFLLLAMLIAACGSSAATPAASTAAASGGALTALPSTIDAATAASMQEAGAFVLDVREPDEWAAGHIDGATLIPLGELASRTAEVPQDQDIVVVCHSGNRSAQGRDILLAAGYPAVTSMDGGMTAWTAAGLPVVTGS